jgi:ATP-binding cassette subfamily B protein
MTQSIVDVGIDNQDIHFIYLILFGQLAIFIGQLSVRVIQSWILLHISTRINVHLISDFLQKLMKLPLGFFDSRNTGDLLQRIGDHRRIEAFLTQSSLSILLSSINLLVFGVVLLMYSIPIFFIFLFSSMLYIFWISFFLKRRREIDYMAFQQMSDNQSSLIEIIQGMPEIKLQGSHFKRRWAWASIQARLFRIQMKSLAISQYQDIGGSSINQVKDILITFMAARAVIEGQMTLGMMLAVQYIIGQLNSPLQQLINFIRSAQDARISYERLSEVHSQDDEQSPDETRMKIIPGGDIILHDLNFRYTPIADAVLTDIHLTIPRGKVTAIVGTSGSGKTTLIKLLLGFYKPTKGYIKIGNTALEALDKATWRASCGVVMQEGYIFSDTIAENIAESSDHVDMSKLLNASVTANIQEFIKIRIFYF